MEGGKRAASDVEPPEKLVNAIHAVMESTTAMANAASRTETPSAQTAQAEEERMQKKRGKEASADARGSS